MGANVSWLSDLGRSIVEGVVTAGRAIVAATTPVFDRVVQTAHRVLNAIRDGIRKEFRSPPQTERERTERDLEDVNDSIMALRARRQKTGALSAADKREFRRLDERRNDLARELEAIDNVFHAEDIVDDSSQYQELQIDDDLAHVLQFHAGQNTTNKQCPACGRAMILQWKRELEVARVPNFYWGCTGYYFRPKCLHTDKLIAADLRLFVNLSHPEFAMSPQDLCERFKRNEGGIKSRLMRLGKLTPAIGSLAVESR